MAENELIKILYATLSPDLATRQAAESALELGASQEGVSRRGGQSRIQSCCLTGAAFCDRWLSHRTSRVRERVSVAGLCRGANHRRVPRKASAGRLAGWHGRVFPPAPAPPEFVDSKPARFSGRRRGPPPPSALNMPGRRPVDHADVAGVSSRAPLAGPYCRRLGRLCINSPAFHPAVPRSSPSSTGTPPPRLL